jgi:hypothetical protein
MAINSFTPNTIIKSAEENANWNNFLDHGRNFTMKWAFSGTLVTGTTKDYIALPDTGTIARVDLVVDTAPTGAALIVDIERSTDSGATWVTIFTNQANRPQIAVSNKVGNTTTIDVPGATQNTHLFRANIEQVGSTVAGADLSVMVRGTYDVD